MALASISIWRPRDKRLQDFFGKVSEAKKIHERLGARVRVWQSTFGGQPMTIIYVIEHAGWAAFGKFGEKLESDSEWQQFWANALEDPTADLVQNSVISEPPGLT